MSAPPGAPASVTTVRSLVTASERLDAVRLYRETFGLPHTDPAITPKLLCALQRTGGTAVGAFGADGRLVGFTYGFVGLDGATPYHYSQTAAVDSAVQGLGVGRRLKRAQAELARGTGVHTMRWAYDPLQARNAHFNLDVLGAVGRWFHRDYYGMYDDLGRTDRVIVEWRLDDESRSERSDQTVEPPPDVPPWGRCVHDGGAAWLAVPADWSEVRRSDPAAADDLREEVAAELERVLTGDTALLSCHRVDAGTALYRIGEAGR